MILCDNYAAFENHLMEPSQKLLLTLCSLII